jgi:hypothetical protein
MPGDHLLLGGFGPYGIFIKTYFVIAVVMVMFYGILGLMG